MKFSCLILLDSIILVNKWNLNSNNNSPYAIKIVIARNEYEKLCVRYHTDKLLNVLFKYILALNLKHY